MKNPVKIDITHHGTHQLQGDALKTTLLLAVGITFSLSAFAQTNPQTTIVGQSTSPASIYHVNVISRTVQAVNYQHRSGATKLDFAGTHLMPSANGQA
jgi:hypothetical protein